MLQCGSVSHANNYVGRGPLCLMCAACLRARFWEWQIECVAVMRRAMSRGVLLALWSPLCIGGVGCSRRSGIRFLFVAFEWDSAC